MKQPERRDMLEPHINDRGLAYMPNIPGTVRRTSVNVHDSSNAEHDALWLETRGYHNRDGDGGAAQITIDDALILASQICALAERRGYSTPVTRAALARHDVDLGNPARATHPDGALTFPPGTAPQAGDIIRYSYDGDTETARIRLVREDGTIETESVDLPLGHEFAPIKGMMGNPLDECGHRADGTELTRCGYPSADHEPNAGYCSVEEREVGVIVTHAPGCDGIQCGNSTVVPDDPQPLVTQIDPNTERFERVDDNIASLADRLEHLERCYREVPRPQDVGVMAAHLAKIERLESELAEARREINAHKDVLGQVGAEKRKLEAQLEAHHQHDADPRRAVDIVKVNRDLTRQLHEAQRELGGMRDRERAVDTVIESVVDGKIRLAEWVDPETPAGRVYELIATLLRQAHDAERQGDAGALENVEAAVTTYERGDNPLEIGLPDGTLAVRIALALHNSRQRITDLEREMTAITDYVAAVAPGDDDDTPLTRVRYIGARARIEGIAEFVERQSAEYRKHSAQAVDEDRALAVRMGVPPSRFLSDGELSERESDAAATIINAGGEFTASVEGAVAAAEREADTDE